MMKNWQQNLLIILALSLCGLCVYQWYGQTLQRTKLEDLSQVVFLKSAAIQTYTNTIKTIDRQVAELDARITELKAAAKTNDLFVLGQQREMDKLRAANAGLTNTVAEYKKVLTSLEAKLQEAYDGIQKQNTAVKELVAQRDDFVKKFNDSVKERNEIVGQYNELVAKVAKAQGGEAKPANQPH
jgi:chromosome segregation ATPase